jgi:fructose-specific phosphotransferase system IIB component
MKIALVTACLAGVAHSKMAAAALKKVASKRGHEISIEEQGGHKVPTRLTQAQIDEADVVIIAKMVRISGKERFKNKLVLDVSVNKALRSPDTIMDKAEALVNSSHG